MGRLAAGRLAARLLSVAGRRPALALLPPEVEQGLQRPAAGHQEWDRRRPLVWALPLWRRLAAARLAAVRRLLSIRLAAVRLAAGRLRLPAAARRQL